MKLPIDYRKTNWAQHREAREEYIRIQYGLCCFCKTPLSEEPPKSLREKYPLKIDKRRDGLMVSIPKSDQTIKFPLGMLNNPIHLHHDHETGLTIGAIHALCNIMSFVYFE